MALTYLEVPRPLTLNAMRKARRDLIMRDPRFRGECRVAVHPDEEPQVRDIPGFTPVYRYASHEWPGTDMEIGRAECFIFDIDYNSPHTVDDDPLSHRGYVPVQAPTYKKATCDGCGAALNLTRASCSYCERPI
jgi:hypothetical protein